MLFYLDWCMSMAPLAGKIAPTKCVILDDLTFTKAMIKATKKVNPGRVPLDKIFKDFFDHFAFFHDDCTSFKLRWPTTSY